MPIHPTPGGGWQWGGHGKIYKGKGAKRRAILQMIAAEHNGYKDPGMGRRGKMMKDLTGK